MKQYFVFHLLLLCFVSSCTVKESKPQGADDRCGINSDDYNLCSDFTPDSPQFVVAVAGDGVPDSTMSRKREYPINRAQGIAMWKGIHLAYEKSPTVADIKRYIKLKSFDDGGSGECANKLAQAIYTNQCVLAVIGHATSGTTAEAAHIYQKGGIPLIMPIATSPSVFYPPGDTSTNDRIKTSFRLPPSDDKFQTYALAITAIHRLNASHIFLLGDKSTDAETYAKPIFTKLKDELLGTSKRASQEVTRNDALGIAFNIKKENPDLVLFCGYWTNFKPILAALEEQYRTNQNRPFILLSDGCKTDDLQTYDFPVFITFPSPDILTTKNTSPDLEFLRALIQKQNGNQSFEMFGYDAMLLLAQAIADAKKEGISRNSVLNALRTRAEFQGSSFKYSFKDGESTNLNYYVFEARTKKTCFEITPDDITNFKKTNKLE